MTSIHGLRGETCLHYLFKRSAVERRDYRCLFFRKSRFVNSVVTDVGRMGKSFSRIVKLGLRKAYFGHTKHNNPSNF